MDAMMMALKKKRAGQPDKGLLSEEHESPEHEAKEDEGGMQALVAKLSPEQKEELKELLAQEGSEAEQDRSMEVAKGGASSEEKAQIDKKMAEEPTEDTDEMMINGDSVVKNKMAKGVPPKGLAERAKMYAMERMKAKGKV